MPEVTEQGTEAADAAQIPVAMESSGSQAKFPSPLALTEHHSSFSTEMDLFPLRKYEDKPIFSSKP